MKLGIIGCGKMGGAICQGVVASGACVASDVFVFEVNPAMQEYAKKQGYNTVNAVKNLFDCCNVVLFAIKPQEAKAVIDSINGKGNAKLVISIMAGVNIATLQKIDNGLAVARVMPNTCAMIGKSASSICYNALAGEEHKTLARTIIGAVGSYVEIDESLMDEVIPIGGSFTAYAYLFIKSFIESSVKRGIDREIATQLVLSSMIGSTEMVKTFGDVDTLIQNVCSKGGTTLAGLEQLKNGNFEQIIDDCCIACANRSKELGKI